MRSVKRGIGVCLLLVTVAACGPSASAPDLAEREWFIGGWMSGGLSERISFGDNQTHPKLVALDDGTFESWWLAGECNDDGFERASQSRWEQLDSDTVQLFDVDGTPVNKIRRTDDCNVVESVDENLEVARRYHRGDYCVREVDNGPPPDDGLEHDPRYVCSSYRCGTDFIEDCDEP